MRQQPSKQANRKGVELSQLVISMPKKTRHNAPQLRKNAPRKRFKGKADAPDLPVVKFKVEELGNKACCCRIGR